VLLLFIQDLAKKLKIMKILIAEDNKIIQGVYKDFINRLGYDFDMASNGIEAVEYAGKNEGKYDICLMDIDMPVMSGIEATEIIRKRHKYFPILAFSGNHMVRTQCLKIGMDDFLEKPCGPKELLAKIKELTVKSVKVDTRNNNLLITKEMPMNTEEAAVLMQLKEQHLSMISIFGTSTGAKFVVKEAVPQYIENEFTENKKLSVRFLDHNPEGKGLCRLFAKTSMVVKSFMLDEDFESENKQEIEKFKTIIIDNG